MEKDLFGESDDILLHNDQIQLLSNIFTERFKIESIEEDETPEEVDEDQYKVSLFLLSLAHIVNIDKSFLIDSLENLMNKKKLSKIKIPKEFHKFCKILNVFVSDFSTISDKIIPHTTENELENQMKMKLSLDSDEEEDLQDNEDLGKDEDDEIEVTQKDIDTYWNSAEFGDLESSKNWEKLKNDKQNKKAVKAAENLFHENLDYEQLGDELESLFFKFEKGKKVATKKSEKVEKEFRFSDSENEGIVIGEEEENQEGEEEEEEAGEEEINEEDLNEALLFTLGTEHSFADLPKGQVSKKALKKASDRILLSKYGDFEEETEDVDALILNDHLNDIISGNKEPIRHVIHQENSDGEVVEIIEEIVEVEETDSEEGEHAPANQQLEELGIEVDTNEIGIGEDSDEYEVVYEEIEVTDDDEGVNEVDKFEYNYDIGTTDANEDDDFNLEDEEEELSLLKSKTQTDWDELFND